jgi:hypothetical protein
VAYKCGGIEITPEALERVSLAAREWSVRADLTAGQRTMAHALEEQAARLATASAVTGKEIALVKTLCCHLFAAVNGGMKPDRAQWPCSPRSEAASVN